MDKYCKVLIVEDEFIMRQGDETHDGLGKGRVSDCRRGF